MFELVQILSEGGLKLLFWPRLNILWATFTARPTRPLWLLLTLIVFYKFIFRSSNSTEKGKQPNGKTDS